MPGYYENEAGSSDRLKKAVRIVIYLLVITILVFLALMVFDTIDSNGKEAPENMDSQTLTTVPVISESEEGMLTATPQPVPTEALIPLMSYADPTLHGFDAEKLNQLDTFIQEQINDGFPGAVIMIAKDGKIVYQKAYGYSKKYEGVNLLNQFDDMQLKTMFDLASLTKIYSTTFSIMKLADQGKLSLNDTVDTYLPDYTGSNKNLVTIEMLLSHNAGYTQSYYFYTEDSEYFTRDRDTIFAYIQQIPLDDTPGSVYSYNNLNYMLLGLIVEKVSGMRLDEFAKTYIYEPLSIEDEVTYRPLDAGIAKQDIAATERQGNTRDGSVYFNGIRQYTIQGEVHDETAYYCIDQVSGHAGLFASPYGLTILNQLLLNGGEYEGIRIYSEETVDNWLRFINDGKYQLGFWNAEESSQKLKGYVPDFAFYHNGWTGTATILDVENSMSIILLTNKRHSPCPDGDFEGTHYSIANYTAVIQKIYTALTN